MTDSNAITISKRDFAALNKRAQLGDRNAAIAKVIAKWCVVVLVALFALLLAWRLVSPQLNLYRANTEKQAAIAEAKAKAEAAVFLKESEITRSEGVAEANQIIAESITDEYVRWLYVDQLDEVDGQVIYVATEAGLPILEANRLSEQGDDE